MLLGTLDLDGSQVSGTFSKLSGGVAGLSSTLSTVGAPLLAIGAAIAALAATAAAFGATLNLGGQLNDLSLQTGESVSDLVTLRVAFDDAGLGADAVGDTLLKFQNTLAGMNGDVKATKDSLAALGVTADELKQLPAIEQMKRLQTAFAGVADQSTKVAAARDLFERSGGKLLAIFNDPAAFTNAAAAAGPLVAVMERNIATFATLGDTIGHLKLNVQEFFAGALSKIAPEATSIAEALASIDFVGIGQMVGTLAGTFLKLVDVLTGPLAGALNVISKGLGAVFGGSGGSPILAANPRGFSRLNRDPRGDDNSVITGLQKIGGGGGFGGGDPMLSESRTQTRLLQRIADGVARQPGQTRDPVPV